MYMQGYHDKAQSPPARRAALLALLTFAALLLGACGGDKAPVKEQSLGEEASQATPGNDGATPQVLILDDGRANLDAADGDDSGTTAAPKMNHAEDYARYRGMNPDVVGWISVPNTRVEYPVLHRNTGPQNTNIDNEYYLVRNPNEEPSKSGSIFLDARNTDVHTARHIIVYGHNMRSGSMFADLQNYKNADFFENNRDFTMHWGDEAVHYEIYSAGVASTDNNFIKTDFASDDEFLNYFNKLRGLSKFAPKPSVTLTKDDQILTMVTCTYEYDNSRYIIQARRVNY